ncbi:MAG: Spy0128 family protein, partial [Enterococcus sp.]
MKKFIKGLAVGLATLSAVVGITLATAKEVKAEELGPKNTAFLTKELQIPNGVIVPETTFEFTVTPKGVESGGGTLDETRKDECLTWEIDDITFSSSEKATTNNKIVKSTDVWTKIADLKFAAPGIYYYEIAETQPGSVGDITYSKAEYTVRILVENTDDGPKVTGIIVDRLKDGDGKPVTGKVDPTPNPDDDNHSEFRFINKYRGLTKVQVKKIVAGDGSGDFGDREKDFKFTITLNLPETVSADFDEVAYSKKNVGNDEVAHEKVTISNRTGESKI